MKKVIGLWVAGVITSLAGGGGALAAERLSESAPPATTLLGADTNQNGIRDEIEETLKQVLSSWLQRPPVDDYNKLLEVVKLVQPTDVPRAIDMRKFYCRYGALPAAVKEKVSARMILTLVTDTPERKKALARQAINTSGSLGAEVCE